MQDVPVPVADPISPSKVFTPPGRRVTRAQAALVGDLRSPLHTAEERNIRMQKKEKVVKRKYSRRKKKKKTKATDDDVFEVYDETMFDKDDIPNWIGAELLIRHNDDQLHRDHLFNGRLSPFLLVWRRVPFDADRALQLRSLIFDNINTPPYDG